MVHKWTEGPFFISSPTGVLSLPLAALFFFFFYAESELTERLEEAVKMEETRPMVYSPYRQHILLSYFKTLSVGPVWGSNFRPSAQQTGALSTELTRWRLLRLLHQKTETSSCLDHDCYFKLLPFGPEQSQNRQKGRCFNKNSFSTLDINECALYPGICPYPSRCRNTIGGHTCDCPKGFISHRQKICIGKEWLDETFQGRYEKTLK